MPITAQRRAGVPVSFVEPALLGDINVTLGPASVHFGPGAMGGALTVEPRWFDGKTAMGSYASSGDESLLMGGYGNESLSIGAALHRASDSESANGTPLNTSFERRSASLQYHTRLDSFDLDALLLPSTTKDIGKSNSRYPTRDSTYPEDEHLLGRLRVRHDSGLEASLYSHGQSLLTHNQRPGSADSYAYIESNDFGGTLQQTLDQGDLTYNFGLEYLGRRDVNGFDARGSLDNPNYSLQDASENNGSLFAIIDWSLSDPWQLELGARFSRIDQSQAGVEVDNSDSAFSISSQWTPDAYSHWSLTLASGYRFATLEERFFSGVTPQGGIVGNPNLESEHSTGLDLGYDVQFDDWNTRLHLWHTRVTDLIQMVDLVPEVNGYTNIGKAKLQGAELFFGIGPIEALNLDFGVALVDSKDEATGKPLYGAPPVTAVLDIRYRFDLATLGLLYQHRWAKTDPGFEEVERDAVDLLDIEVDVPLQTDWSLQFFIRNALNEDYYATADELSALGQERSVGVNLVWTAH